MSAKGDLLSPYRGLPQEIYVIFMSRVINALGCFVMPLLTLILTEKVGLAKDTAGLYLSLAGLMYLPASLLGGKLADRYGRKKVMVFFDSLAAGLYILCGLLSPSLAMVLVLMLAGAAMFTAGPAHDALMADLTTPANRSGAYSLSYMGWNIGFAVGPVLGGLLFERHLAWVFIGDALTALLALGLIIVFVKETLPSGRAAIAGPDRFLEKPEDGSIFSVLLRRPVLVFFALIAFGYNFAYAQWSFLLPIQILENLGPAGARYFGLVAGCNGLVVMLFTPVLTKVCAGVKTIRKMVYGGVLYAVGFGMLGVLYSLPFLFVWAFVFTLGEILLAISTAPFIANHTPASHRGRMSAAIPMIAGLGNTLGPLGMGRLLKFVNVNTGWQLIGVLTLVFSVLMYALEKFDDRQVLARQGLDRQPLDKQGLDRQATGAEGRNPGHR